MREWATLYGVPYYKLLPLTLDLAVQCILAKATERAVQRYNQLVMTCMLLGPYTERPPNPARLLTAMERRLLGIREPRRLTAADIERLESAKSAEEELAVLRELLVDEEGKPVGVPDGSPTLDAFIGAGGQE